MSTPHHDPDLKDYVQILLAGNLLDAELQVTSLVIPANRRLFIFVDGVSLVRLATLIIHRFM